MLRGFTDRRGRTSGRRSVAGLCLVLLVLVDLAGGPPLFGQDLEGSGYLEHQLYPQSLRGRLVAMDYTKIRVDANANLLPWLALTGDVVGQMQHGKTHFNSFDFIPTSVVASFASAAGTTTDALRDDFDFHVENEHYVDNAFLTAYAGEASARFGRQQLPWGTGYAWNPTDIFHEKNFLDPTYEKRGVDAFKIVVPFSTMGTVTAVVGLKNLWNEAKKAVRFKDHVSGFDYSVSLMQEHVHELDFVTSSSADVERRFLAGDLSGSVGEFGVWFEGAYVNMPERSDRMLALFGADHTTESGLYLITEYYHNGFGVSSSSDYTFNRWMRLIGETGENLGQDYLFLGESYPLTDLLTGSSYAILSLTDRSFVVYPYLEYSLSDNAVLTLIGYAPVGNATSEFGAFGWGAIVRGRYYF